VIKIVNEKSGNIEPYSVSNNFWKNL